MNRLSVDPRKIMVPEVRVTASWDNEMYSMFKDSIKSLGIIEPVVCVQVNGNLVLVDGLHRTQEALARGDKKIDIVVMPGSMADVHLQNLALNNLRGKTKASEMVKVIKVLTEECQMDSEQIAKKTGFTRDYIERLWVIAEAPARVREALDDDLIKVGHAYAIAKIADTEAQDTVLTQQLMYRWPVATLNEYIGQVQAHLATPPQVPIPLPAAGPATVPCAYCGQDTELRFVTNPNTCASCYGTIAAAMRQSAPSHAVESAP